MSDSGWPMHIVVGFHSPNDDIRNFLMPCTKGKPIVDLFKALKRHIKKTGRRVVLDYALIEGLNDSLDDAKKLYAILKDMPFELRISMIIAFMNVLLSIILIYSINKTENKRHKIIMDAYKKAEKIQNETLKEYEKNKKILRNIRYTNKLKNVKFLEYN